ncbi:MAG: ABC transporter permease [Bacillota bacterium]|jgi:peptide/nickel transport system permease protein|nr:ABC transporter permease [Bacillota bacterium]HHU29154.1 ABC transporter permease [Bacillota bacterium]
MANYIVRRLLWGLVILILVSLIVFFAIRMVPGDPLTLFVSRTQESGFSFTKAQLDALRRRFGLDKPVIVQYVDWISNMLRGDLGESIYYRQDVAKLIKERLPVTLYLGIIGFLLSLIVGTTAGLLAGMRRATWIDNIIVVISYIGIAIPVFWLGYLLIFAFGMKLRILPIGGYTSPFEDFWYSLRQIIMPVICMVLPGIAGMARQMRSSYLEVAGQDYIRTAWAKGLTEKAVVMKHILKNSLIPIVTLLGMSIGGIFGGSVLVENVFAIPGMGRFLVQGIFQQDYVIMQANTFLMAVMIILSNLIVDISYGWFDPRIRYD